MCVWTWLCFLQFPARAPPLLHNCRSLPATPESGHQHCDSRPPTPRPDLNSPLHPENLLPTPARTPQPLRCSVCLCLFPPLFFKHFNIVVQCTQGLPWWLSGKEPACQCRRGTVRSQGREDPLEKEVATHSSILAWGSPWTEEPGGL